jgi:DNA polymerase elongation subunit (family B)
MHNFKLTVVDTDSIAFTLADGSFITPEHRQALLDEINSKFPELIKYADDGYFPRCIALKAKNYILFDGTKIKVKGSSLKATTKSQALKDFTNDVIKTMVYTENVDEIPAKLQVVYAQYVEEAMNVKEIKRWSARKTLSSTMQESERTNETKVIAALEGSDYREGDRMWLFYKPDDSLCLAERFEGEYNRVRLLKNIWDTIQIFSTVLPTKQLFINYSLKKNYKTLEEKYLKN